MKCTRLKNNFPENWNQYLDEMKEKWKEECHGIICIYFSHKENGKNFLWLKIMKIASVYFPVGVISVISTRHSMCEGKTRKPPQFIESRMEFVDGIIPNHHCNVYMKNFRHANSCFWTIFFSFFCLTPVVVG